MVSRGYERVSEVETTNYAKKNLAKKLAFFSFSPKMNYLPESYPLKIINIISIPKIESSIDKDTTDGDSESSIQTSKTI